MRTDTPIWNLKRTMKMRNLHHYIRDYMGNNRMVVNRDGTIEQITHYYPYGPRSHRESIFMLSARRRGFSRGQVIGDISTNESLQKFKFEGKVLAAIEKIDNLRREDEPLGEGKDRTFGLDSYDIEARQYFSMAPMWDRIDKKAEDYYGISPYAYCGGDPVNFVDPDGMEPTMDEAGQMSLYMYGVFSLESISGGWNLVYQLQEQQDGYIAALFSRSHESTTEYAYVFRGTIGELDEKDWVTNLVEQPLGISTQCNYSGTHNHHLPAQDKLRVNAL